MRWDFCVENSGDRPLPYGLALHPFFLRHGADRFDGGAGDLGLYASPEFARLVVYTPANAPWFCLENQTSSTDCHNLYAAGLQNAANLQLVAPGQCHRTWVEFRFSLQAH